MKNSWEFNHQSLPEPEKPSYYILVSHSFFCGFPTMGETGIGRFPGNLDPRAQEFRPGNPNQYQYQQHHHHQAQLCLFPQPPQPLYYPYTTPFSATELQVVPFCEAGVGYVHAPQQHHPAYVSSHVVQVAPVLPPSAAATRTLVLSSVPSEVGEGLVRRELEAFGEVRAIEMERIQEGIVTVHFYDLRHADKALREIRDQHMQHQARLRNHYCTSATTGSFLGTNSGTHVDNFGARGLIAGRPVWAHFVIPFAHAVPDGHNQGTIVIFNLDSQVSKTSLKEIFDAFGMINSCSFVCFFVLRSKSCYNFCRFTFSYNLFYRSGKGIERNTIKETPEVRGVL